MYDLAIYDNETTDADVRHAQITQFASIVFDPELRQIDSLDIRTRLLPWVVPTPKACEVTGQTPQSLADSSHPSEFEALCQVSSFLQPEQNKTRYYVTYNGVKFDDELLRTSFYRNLLNPWFNSGQQSRRIDILPLVQLVHAAKHPCLKIPITEEGKPSYRLDRVAPANGLIFEAHDAMGDVKATAGILQKIINGAPWVFDLAQRCSHASLVEKTLFSSRERGEILWLFTCFGKPEFRPVLCMGTDTRKKFILVDLSYDELPNDVGGIQEKLFRADSAFPIIRSNAFPLLLDRATMQRIDPDLDTVALEGRLERLRDDRDLQKRAIAALKGQTYESRAFETSEQRIYGGFFNSADKAAMGRFLNQDWAERAAIEFADDRLSDFSARICLDAHYSEETCYDDATLHVLRNRAREALVRPFAGPDANHATIVSCLSDDADENWIEWARARYGADQVDGLIADNDLAGGVHRGDDVASDIAENATTEADEAPGSRPAGSEAETAPRQMSFGF